MSLRLGVIMSKNCDLSQLNNLREKYSLGLIRINNKYVNRQLMDGEMFLQATQTGYDSLTGIGAYYYYNQDISKVYNIIKNKRIADINYNEMKEAKEIYKKDALQWIDIIKCIKCKYKIDRFGLFWHMFTTSIENEKILITKRLFCKLEDISMEYLMKIERDQIVYFE